MSQAAGNYNNAGCACKRRKTKFFAVCLYENLWQWSEVKSPHCRWSDCRASLSLSSSIPLTERASPPLVYPFAAIRSRPAECIFCWQNKGLLFHHVRDRFAECRQICCDSVATAGTKEGRKNGLWLGTDTRHGFAGALRPADAPYRVSDQRPI
jgi:hypothetical protein